MKNLLILLSVTILHFGLQAQAPTVAEIGKYVHTIDSLKQKGKLKKVGYSNMSACGGALYGFYYKGKLVYIDSEYGGEDGFTSKDVYLKNDIPYKIRFRKVEGRSSSNTDTLFTYVLSAKPYMYITSRSKTIRSGPADKQQLTLLLECIACMQKELKSEENPH